MTKATIASVEKEMKAGFKAVNERFDKRDKDMQEFHDFMIVQQDRGIRKPSGQIDWNSLLSKLLVFLTVAATIILAVIQAFTSKVQP